jgi:DNA-binding NtrC family response regulator
VTPAAERVLQHAHWGGNIRELRNVVERACILSENKILNERDLIDAIASTPGALEASAPPATQSSPANPDARRAHIEHVLQQVAGNKSAAAKLLGMNRRSLYRWLDRLDLRP